MSEYFLFGGKKFVPEQSPLPPLWRVKHDKEMGSLWRANLPEVHPMFPNHHSEFGRTAQLLSRAMNPRFTPSQWTKVYGHNLWVTNNNGFGDPETERINYVTGANVGNSQAEPPRVEALTTGGSYHTGHVEGSNLVLETLDVNNLPTLDWIMARPWFWVWAVSVDGLGNPRRFPQGLQPNGEVVPFIHPMITNRTRYPKITIPLAKLQRWTATELPDPFKLYLV